MSMTAKTIIGRTTRLREGLDALRGDIMKADALNKEIRLREVIYKHKLPIMTATYLQNIGAILDMTEPGPRKAEKRIKWIYTRSGENGHVDGKLLEDFSRAEKKYNQEYRDQKRNGTLEVTAILEKQLSRLPTRKDDGLPSISIWLKDKLEKNTQVSGYLRADEQVIYEKLLTMIDALQEVKTVINKLQM